MATAKCMNCYLVAAILVCSCSKLNSGESCESSVCADGILLGVHCGDWSARDWSAQEKLDFAPGRKYSQGTAGTAARPSCASRQAEVFPKVQAARTCGG